MGKNKYLLGTKFSVGLIKFINAFGMVELLGAGRGSRIVGIMCPFKPGKGQQQIMWTTPHCRGTFFYRHVQ